MTRTTGGMFLAAVVAICFSACPPVARAQKPAGLPGGYPAKPVRVVLGSSPGGSLDISGRMVMPKLAERWGSTFVLENIASGIGGVVAMDMVVKAPADGYTLLVSAGSTFVNASLVNKPTYDVRKAFAPVAQFVSTSMILAVNPALPVASVKELVAYAKANPSKLNYASAGIGSSQHIAGEMLNHMFGVDMLHIPYKGLGPGIIDAVGGRVQVIFGTPLALANHIRSGKLRAIATTAGKRIQFMPDLPTVAEQGMPGYETISWLGLVAPTGVPQPIVQALNREVVQVLGLPDVAQKLSADGSDPAPVSPEQFRDTINGGIDRVARLVKETGLKLE